MFALNSCIGREVKLYVKVNLTFINVKCCWYVVTIVFGVNFVNPFVAL